MTYLFISLLTVVSIDALFLKTMVFLSHQISHDVNIIREANPFLVPPLTFITECHQSFTELKLLQSSMFTC